MAREDVSMGRSVRRNGRETLGMVDPQILALAGPGAAQMRAIAPGEEPLLFASFAGGYATNASAEKLPENASPLLIDFEVTRGDRLVRAPGTTEIEVLEHTPSAALVHSNLDASSELLLFAAPFVGVKKNAATVWLNEGILPDGHWVGTNYAGTYIFTNGRENVYAREPNDVHIRATTIPVGRALASWNGRLWVANAIIGGNFLPMGVTWSSAVGNFEDFTGVGTGFEELIYDFAEDDGIVAMRAMSLDYMAIICKKSLWIARRTNEVDEPATIEPIEPGIGCVSERTVHLVFGGVEYLSEVGVQIFDGERSINVSEQINTEILPIQQDKLNQYWGHYDAKHRRYELGTPDGVWIHDIMFNRWYKRSMIADAGFNFPDELPTLTWDDEVGSWDEATDDWADADPNGRPDRTVFLKGNALHFEDYTSQLYFGESYVPRWRSKSTMAGKLRAMMLVKGIQFRYRGAGEIRVLTEDTQGELVEYMVRRLPSTNGILGDAAYTGVKAGLRATMEVQLLSGVVEFDIFGMSVQVGSEIYGRL